ncbi:DNA adenine methylase [Candidatus Parcubacteria bacterium]|nr:DNA adenine methylase [Candidatus Parcubacteria bacterium]
MLTTKIKRKHYFTPLRYPGGKTSLFNYFDQIIKDNKWRDIKYIEPYAGGAGAALSLLLLEKVDSIVINDYDPAIYAFWKSVLDNTDDFIDLIDSTPLSVNEWETQKRIYKIADYNKLLRLGFATFYLNRTNRSGVLNGGPIGGKAQEGNWKIDARYNKKALIDRIRLISLYKDRIKVTKSDGIKVIKKYAIDPKAFLYIDPPYFVKGANLYLNAFKLEDHKRLAEVLNELNNSKWILTYDNEENIKKLYLRRRQEPFSLKYSVHRNSKVGSEIMIFSDSIN